MEFLYNADGELRGIQIDFVAILSLAVVLINTWMTRESLRETILCKLESFRIKEWLIGIPDEKEDE